MSNSLARRSLPAYDDVLDFFHPYMTVETPSSNEMRPNESAQFLNTLADLLRDGKTISALKLVAKMPQDQALIRAVLTVFHGYGHNSDTLRSHKEKNDRAIKDSQTVVLQQQRALDDLLSAMLDGGDYQALARHALSDTSKALKGFRNRIRVILSQHGINPDTLQRVRPECDPRPEWAQ